MASEGTSWDDDGFAAAEGAHTQHSDEQVDNFAQDSHVSGESADNGTEDGGDYDPEYVPVETVLPDSPVPEDAASAAPAVLSQRPTPKPKMSGGFLVEASDDEEDDEGDNSGPAEPSVSQSQVDQPTEIKANVPVLPVSTNVPSIVTATPMASLDPVTLFEARIKEDPRGDMDAWVNLIAEHRRNNRLDDVRKIYNQFLENFPQSVSLRGLTGRPL